MKKITKRVIALLIMFSMTICCVMGNEMNPAHAEETSKNLVVKAENSLNGSIEMEISITASWDNHYNADVTLKNKLDEKIDNWMIAFDFNNNIENIWNAKIISHEEDHYVVSLTMPNRTRREWRILANHFVFRPCLAVKQDFVL